jgi:hypothetical protein
VTVRELDGRSQVSLLDPRVLLSADVLSQNQAMQEVAEDARKRLARVADELAKPVN